jgi:hypothetical protein
MRTPQVEIHIRPSAFEIRDVNLARGGRGIIRNINHCNRRALGEIDEIILDEGVMNGRTGLVKRQLFRGSRIGNVVQEEARYCLVARCVTRAGNDESVLIDFDIDDPLHGSVLAFLEEVPLFGENARVARVGHIDRREAGLGRDVGGSAIGSDYGLCRIIDLDRSEWPVFSLSGLDRCWHNRKASDRTEQLATFHTPGVRPGRQKRSAKGTGDRHHKSMNPQAPR